MKKAMKRVFGVLGSLLLLAGIAILLVWCFPEKVLTSERVSGWVAPLVRFERAKDDPFPNAPMVTLEIGKEGFLRRSIAIRLAPGCYAPAAESKDGTEACIATANLGVSFRLSRKNYIRLTGLDRLEIRVSRGRFVAKPDARPEEPKEPSAGRFRYLRYLDRGFAWGPIAIQIDRFEIPAGKMTFRTKIESAEKDYRGKGRSPKLSIEAEVDSPDWSARVGGEVFQRRDRLVVPNASVTYRRKAKAGSERVVLGGELHAEYGLDTGDLDAGFAVNWKDPAPEIEALRADDGTIRMRKEELSARATLKALLQGKTPLGHLPLLTASVAAAMRSADDTGNRSIDFDLGIDAYEFAGIRAKSDLAVTLVPSRGGNELRWRKGDLRIEVSDFGKTVRLLSRTAWAIPAPFNVFSGPIAFRTGPFRVAADRTTVPAVLTTDLRSTGQALATETKIEADVARRNLGLLGVRVDALLRKVQFRLPDYEPLAPVPALARDSRIVRFAKPKVPVAAPSPSIPFLLSLKGPPGSIVLLNRFFDPSLAAGVDLATDPETRAFRGAVSLSTPFDLHYLNRAIRFERLDLAFRPALEANVRISMERGGYHIFADLRQGAGKTRISLGSEPPLEQSEIVSLILYGMPGNSISSEQTRSVGSAQAAMGSEALGIFSFWAFAATPIESVLYDPETQTYSAVVRLPGGVVASIGSNWDNERQLALSKSLGRNWAVSTELIKDSQGVDRGGTLLRWRKSY